MSVPQTLLKLASKLAQVEGYCLGLQDGVRGSGLMKDNPEFVEPIQNGLEHLSGLIEQACAIEQELRQKLRQRGEEV